MHRFFNNGGSGAAPVFAQFLKDSKHPKYTIAQINDYPTTTYAVQIITTLLYAWTSDSVLNGDRLPPIVFGGVCLPAEMSPRLVVQRLISDLGCKHRLLYLSRSVGNSRRLAMDVLHPDGLRVWLIWSLYGVCDAFSAKSFLRQCLRLI